MSGARAGDASPLREKTAELVGVIADEIARVAEPIKRKALDVAEERKQAGALRLDDLAEVVHGAADQVGLLLPEAGGVLRSAADGLEQAATAVQEHSVEEIVGAVADLARRHPLAFLGGAVLLGFACARLLPQSGAPAPRGMADEIPSGKEDAA